ncbi:MAG: hypothetical protein WKF97_23545 [Chitinophagaceae bacterium]
MAISICGQQQTTIFSNKLIENTRLCYWHGLVFFTLLICSCNSKQATEISIRWNNNKATAVLIPERLVKGIRADSVSEWLKVVVLHDSNTTAVLGDYNLDHDVIFEPLIPFSRGLSYEVFYRNKKLGTFQIPAANRENAPKLLAVYPSQDTLPENLLKFYLRFSQPMSEGESYKYITLIREQIDTLHDVFLNLQPELWNAERTVITVWLDPGRIKRGLQPNQGLGSPLEDQSTYTLQVSNKWKDRQGLPLEQGITKSFVASKRDSLSPDPDRWTLHIPKAASRQALTIDCKESMDYFLLEESLSISGQDGVRVEGHLTIDQDGKTGHFIPVEPWVAGNHILIIQSILEDLAGNNINRPFDRDIYTSKPATSKAASRIKFQVTSQAISGG